MEKSIVAFIIISIGLLNIIRPDIMVKWRIWTTKKIYGADYKPTKRTLKVQRFIGIILTLLGCLTITNH